MEHMKWLYLVVRQDLEKGTKLVTTLQFTASTTFFATYLFIYFSRSKGESHSYMVSPRLLDVWLALRLTQAFISFYRI